MLSRRKINPNAITNPNPNQLDPPSMAAEGGLEGVEVDLDLDLDLGLFFFVFCVRLHSTPS